MSYLVLARKWRPQTFEDVVGQEVIIHTLKNALVSGRVAHAFLLTGSRGTGKTTVARILAKALSCSVGITDKPCGTCSNCQAIVSGTSLDVMEIDGASNTGVDDVRELRENARYQPNSARFKIFIIDEVHMLSTSAFNALLKILEEPPPHIKFIFATTEPHKIPITILSRCQRYDFKRIALPVIVKQLEKIVQAEGIQLSSEGLTLIARSAEGGMRDALSLTDQVLSFGSENPSVKEIGEILGVLDRKLVMELVEAILEAQTSRAIEKVRQVHESGHDLKRLLDCVAEEFRHLTMVASMGKLAGFVDYAPEDIAAIEALSQKYEASDLQRLFAMALDGVDSIARSSLPKLMAELVVLRMGDRPHMSEVLTITSAINRLENLAKAAPAPMAASQPILPVSEKKTPEFPSIEDSHGEILEGVPPSWLHFVRALHSKHTLLSTHLEHAYFQANGELLFSNAFHLEGSKELLTQHLKDWAKHYLGCTLQLRLVDELPKGKVTIFAAREKANQMRKEALEVKIKTDPVVQQALSIFGGEIKSISSSEI